MKPDGFLAQANTSAGPAYGKTIGWPGCSQCCPKCSIKVCVTSCVSGSPLAGAVVTIASNPPATCTTGNTGCCSLQIGSSGNYAITITLAGYATYSQSQQFNCGLTYNFVLQLTTQASVIFQASGCSALLAGVTCTVDGQSCTTNSMGQCSISNVPPGTYTWTMSKSRYATQTGSVTVPPCYEGSVYASPFPGIPIRMTPAEGYAFAIWAGQCCVNDPVPTTLSLTDSVAGSCEITFSGDPINGGTWTGSISYTWEGYCGMTPQAAVNYYSWPSGGCHVAVQPTPQVVAIGGYGRYPGCRGNCTNGGYNCSFKNPYNCPYCTCCSGCFFPAFDTFSIEPTVPLMVSQTNFPCGSEVITGPWGPQCFCTGHIWWAKCPPSGNWYPASPGQPGYGTGLPGCYDIQEFGCAVYGSGAQPVITISE